MATMSGPRGAAFGAARFVRTVLGAATVEAGTTREIRTSPSCGRPAATRRQAMRAMTEKSFRPRTARGSATWRHRLKKRIDDARVAEAAAAPHELNRWLISSTADGVSLRGSALLSRGKTIQSPSLVTGIQALAWRLVETSASTKTSITNTKTVKLAIAKRA